jgi:hypothetical protein
METREIKLTLDTASRWYNGNDKELKELALTTFPELGKKELPKSWEELDWLDGYYVDSSSDVNPLNDGGILPRNHNIFATREQAEASIALAQLSQLMKVYNGDWVADWNRITQDKFCIEFCNDIINKVTNVGTSKFLSFKDAETRDLFLENFSDLILTAKPLL